MERQLYIVRAEYPRQKGQRKARVFRAVVMSTSRANAEELFGLAYPAIYRMPGVIVRATEALCVAVGLGQRLED